MLAREHVCSTVESKPQETILKDFLRLPHIYSNFELFLSVAGLPGADEQIPRICLPSSISPLLSALHVCAHTLFCQFPEF